MELKPINLRKLELENDLHLYIRVMRDSPLILIHGSGEVEYARTRGDKDSIVKKFNPLIDLLLFAWVGKYSTDVFTLSMEDIDKHYY